MKEGEVTVQYHVDGQNKDLDYNIKEAFQKMQFNMTGSGFDLGTRIRDISFEYDGHPKEAKPDDQAG